MAKCRETRTLLSAFVTSVQTFAARPIHSRNDVNLRNHSINANVLWMITSAWRHALRSCRAVTCAPEQVRVFHSADSLSGVGTHKTWSLPTASCGRRTWRSRNCSGAPQPICYKVAASSLHFTFYCHATGFVRLRSGFGGARWRKLDSTAFRCIFDPCQESPACELSRVCCDQVQLSHGNHLVVNINDELSLFRDRAMHRLVELGADTKAVSARGLSAADLAREGGFNNTAR